MTRQEAKARLAELHDNRSRRMEITDSEWDEIDACEDVLAATVPRAEMGYYPACFADANPNEI